MEIQKKGQTYKDLLGDAPFLIISIIFFIGKRPYGIG
jgi:hypothetical protein